METINCIKTRRSRRKFLEKELPDKAINQLITCAVSAPSSKDSQPWHFIIVKDKELKIKIAELKGKENEIPIITAPVIIIVCVDTNKSSSRWVEDGITATENLLLAAHDLGLGSVYITGYSPKDPSIAERIKKILSLPDNIMPVTILPVGHPDPNEKLEHKKLVAPEKVIHINKW